MSHPGEPPLYDLGALKTQLERQKKNIESIQGQLAHAIKYKIELETLIAEREQGGPLPDIRTKPLTN